jgi:protein tyrosine phosphatase (PTP) superfamily phosphohydrolase (DUF442 family)
MRKRRFLPDREQFRTPVSGGRGRLAAWVDALFVDFGILRLLWKNRVQFAREAWRMNQPLPQDIAWAKGTGIRSILTARHDPRHGGHALVAAACAEHGLDYQTAPIFSREAPSREAILFAAETMRNAPKPMLLHCKSGADRAGFLAALYLIVVEDVPVEVARRQLSLKHLHIRASKTGILDAVFEAYLAVDPTHRKPFLDWVREDYDPANVTENFKPRPFADFMDRVILRHE